MYTSVGVIVSVTPAIPLKVNGRSSTRRGVGSEAMLRQLWPPSGCKMKEHGNCGLVVEVVITGQRVDLSKQTNWTVPHSI